LKLQQQLAKEAKKCHELSEQWHDQLQRMQTKFADTEQPVRKLQQQLEEEVNFSKVAELKLKQQLTEEANKVRKLQQRLEEEANLWKIAELKLQQQLTEEANKGKGISEQWLDQLQRTQAKLADAEQLAAEKTLATDELQRQLKEAKILGQVIASSELQVQEVWIKINVSAFNKNYAKY